MRKTCNFENKTNNPTMSKRTEKQMVISTHSGKFSHHWNRIMQILISSCDDWTFKSMYPSLISRLHT